MAHPQSEHARSGHVPHPARQASSHRRQLVHLSDVRLGPRPKRLDRRRHALHLHAGVRKPSPAVRLVLRPNRGDAAKIHPPPANRIRPAQSHLHRDEQAAAAGTGRATSTSAAGTIRACRPSADCAAAATRPNRSALFCERIGVAKFNSTIDMAVLENAIREDLNRRAPRRMAVLRPLKVVIDNYPEDRVEDARSREQSRRPAAGTRQSSLFAQSSTSSRTISAKTRPKNSSAWRPGAKCGCAMPTSSSA